MAKHRDVKGDSTLIMFKQGKVAQYAGQRTQEDLAVFMLTTEPEMPFPS